MVALRQHGAFWIEGACAAAVAGGHMDVLKWFRQPLVSDNLSLGGVIWLLLCMCQDAMPACES